MNGAKMFVKIMTGALFGGVVGAGLSLILASLLVLGRPLP